jgi:hypothetical protein
MSRSLVMQLSAAEEKSMIRRYVAATVLLAVSLASSSFCGAAAEPQSLRQADHAAWVARVLEQMLTIQPGMTRSQLLTVFTTEGGVFTGLERQFVSRECPFFKVHVKFEAVGRPSRDSDGRGTSVEGPDDRIVTISRPYLEFSIID